MNTKIKNTWKWIEDHKIEISIGVLCVVTTVMCGVVIKKQIDPDVIMKRIKDTSTSKKQSIWPKVLGPCDLGVGECSDVLLYDGGSAELWLDHVKLSDMGDLGDAIREHFPDLVDGEVWALLNIRPNIKSEG